MQITPHSYQRYPHDATHLDMMMELIYGVQQELTRAMLLNSNKQIALSILPRTRLNTAVCSYFGLSWLDCDLFHECLTPEVDCLTLWCGARVMPNNCHWELYVWKARHTLVKLWLYPLLVCEQDKVASATF